MGDQPAPRRQKRKRPQVSHLDDSVVRAVFERLDANGNGALEAEDAKQAMKMLNLPFSKKNLRYFLKKLDRDHDNVVSYAEFASFVMLHDEALNKVWKTFHSSHHTSPAEFRHAMRKLNVKLTAAQASRLHGEIVSSDDSDFTDFCSVLMLLPEKNAGELLMQWLDESGFDTGDEIRIPQGEGPVASWKLLTSGLVAGIISRTTTAPMDRLKVMLQAHPKNSSVMQTFRFIMREGGALAFWRGNGVNCIKIGPETGIRFWAYENVKRAICKDPEDVTVPERFLAGAAAGSTAQLCIYPLEIAKTRLALAKTGEYRGLLDCLVKLVRAGGLRSAYQGLSASITGIIPYSGVDLTVYTWLRDFYEERYPEENPGVLVPLACGGVATTCGQLVAYPLQLVRTRLQAQGMPGRPVVYDGMLDCFVKTFKSEGVRGLYRGIIPNFMKALPAISISYAAYEFVKARL